MQTTSDDFNLFLCRRYHKTFPRNKYQFAEQRSPGNDDDVYRVSSGDVVISNQAFKSEEKDDASLHGDAANTVEESMVENKEDTNSETQPDDENKESFL